MMCILLLFKVVIDAFRSVDMMAMAAFLPPREINSNISCMQKPAPVALLHGLNRLYYSLMINFRMNELEQTMLAKLRKANWTESMRLRNYREHCSTNEQTIKLMLNLT